MATNVIKGRIDPTEPTKLRRGYAFYKQLVIHLPGGGSRTLDKVSAAGGVRDVIARGGSGEFHISKHAGMLGIHGVELDDGTKIYAHFNNLEMILLIGAGMGAVTLLFVLAGLQDPPLTPLLLGPVLAVAWFVVRSGRHKAKAAFDAA